MNDRQVIAQTIVPNRQYCSHCHREYDKCDGHGHCEDSDPVRGDELLQQLTQATHTQAEAA